MENKSNLGEYVTTIHNPESVVEVYLDKQNQVVSELKCLNYNRHKAYHYSVEEYMQKVKGFKGVDRSVEAVLNN